MSPSRRHGVRQPLHVIVFRVRNWTAERGTQAARNLLPALGKNVVDGALGYGVRFHLLGGEHSFKLADQIGGADDVFAEAANKLDGARIDHGDVHDVVIGRVLHGDGAEAGEHSLNAHGKLLPSGVEDAAAGQRIKTALLNAVHKFTRLALGRNEVVPAARDVRVGIEAKNVRGDGITMMMIVKKPAVDVGLAKSGLDGVEIHG